VINECEEAFTKLKEYLAKLFILSKPTQRLFLRLYFSVTDQAISLVILQEDKKAQRPIYFISKVLHSAAESRYQAIKKAAFTVVFMAPQLRHYFQSFTVIVMTDLPIR